MSKRKVGRKGMNVLFIITKIVKKNLEIYRVNYGVCCQYHPASYPLLSLLLH
jgi:uncharacterized protein YacL